MTLGMTIQSKPEHSIFWAKVIFLRAEFARWDSYSSGCPIPTKNRTWEFLMSMWITQSLDRQPWKALEKTPASDEDLECQSSILLNEGRFWDLGNRWWSVKPSLAGWEDTVGCKPWTSPRKWVSGVSAAQPAVSLVRSFEFVPTSNKRLIVSRVSYHNTMIFQSKVFFLLFFSSRGVCFQMKLYIEPLGMK